MQEEFSEAEVLEALREKIEEHADAIDRIHAAGDVAVLPIDVEGFGAESLLALGWDGLERPFAISSEQRARMVQHFKAVGDAVSACWFAGDRGGRIFFCGPKGTVLVNRGRDGSVSIEPGSTDEGWAS